MPFRTMRQVGAAAIAASLWLVAGLPVASASPFAVLAPPPKTPPEKRAPDPSDEIQLTPGFVCMGESESVMDGLNTRQIKVERDKRLRQLAEGRVASERIAHTHCVVAELMRRIGDHRAEYHYEKAIELNPEEPAYELWYARYLHWSRGALEPLTERAEEHNYKSLEKAKDFESVTQVGSITEVGKDWTRKNLLELYQSDGLALLPWKAHPFDKDGTKKPQISLGATANFAKDTNDFWEFSDVRRFTTEAQVSRTRNTEPLTDDQLRAVVRAPIRYSSRGAFRLRQRYVGAFDLWYRFMRLEDSQITDLADPTELNDVQIHEVGTQWKRTFGLYPAFDLFLRVRYTHQWRTGVVEMEPETLENVDIVNVNPILARYIGPDKLTLGGAFVWFNIPDFPVAPVDQQDRERILWTGFVDYAIYRPLVLSQVQKQTWARKRYRTRGLHFFAIAWVDDEKFGSTVVKRRNWGGGTVLRGWEGFDFTVMGTNFQSRTEENSIVRDALTNSQFRLDFRLRYRIIDPEITPGVGQRAKALSIAFPVRHDWPLEGLNEFRNFRVGTELWGNFFSLATRGTHFLLTAAAEYQYFYGVDKHAVLTRINLRMGWPGLGVIPALS